MCIKNKKVSLGFTNEQFDSGIHICQIYSDEEERTDSISKFILSGLKSNEKVACFSDKEDKKKINHFLQQNGISLYDYLESDKFTLSGANETYFEDNEFDPNRMISLLKSFHNRSVTQNLSGARIIGEMTKNIEQIKGGEKLLEYESKVNKLIEEYPITTVCQYNSNDFSGSSILDILKVHPYMILRGTVVRNPFYINPDEFLNDLTN
ncbi:MEDS domain-containing protein [Draconibacterium halophilum]|uniref:MEDS domain-containing protein n=1 Tax=Draconibacterium halophilum TaxID=2706887 RepID=A0A6C0R7J6_9BACT|nr:MEDS domain-containing protein [Draconibacterium halophilum]QIA06224.1 hypothetical protein G0Q07_00045 [Draconibacterium halophilum]